MKKNKKTVFRGAATALITPFVDGEVDYASLERLIEYQIENGIDALLINGTTGESATLTEQEKREIIAFTVRCVKKRVPVIAGTGSNSTKKAIRLSEFASDVGADAILVVTPYYNKASRDGLITHYEAIADSVDVPLIIYNVPSRTGLDIPLDVFYTLSKHKNIVAVKEASGSISSVSGIIERCSGALDVYSGNDDMILPSLSLGALGVISVASNYLPREISELCRLYFDGKVNEARALQLKLLPLIRALFCEVNPIPIKALMSRYGHCKEEYRLPLTPLSKDKKDLLFKISESL